MDETTSNQRAAMRKAHLATPVTGAPTGSESLRKAQERAQQAQDELNAATRTQQDQLFLTDVQYANARISVLVQAILQFIPQEQQQLFLNLIEEGDRRIAQGIVENRSQRVSRLTSMALPEIPD